MPTTTRRIALHTDLTSIASPSGVVAASRTLLARADPHAPEVVRLFRVRDCVAFGLKDERAPGYLRARAAAHDAGFEVTSRVEGGRAIAAGPSTLGIAWTIPGADGRARIRPRFSMLAAVIADALRAVGVAAEVGPVAGEYCPGDFSVGVGGRSKLAGLGQRVTASGAHLGAFVVIDDAERLRAVLTRVNMALAIAWAPESLGGAADHARGVTLEDVARAVASEFTRRFAVEPIAQGWSAASAVPGGHR